MRHKSLQALLKASATASILLAAAASAQTYPAKAVRFIVPFSAGSPVEIPARPVAQRLAETMGQQFLIDNRPGASGTIGTELVAKAPRDGYTALWTTSKSCSQVRPMRIPTSKRGECVPSAWVVRAERRYCPTFPRFTKQD